MSKAFTKESNGESDEPGDVAEEVADAQPVGVKNYITPGGLLRLKRSIGSCSPGNGRR